MLGDEPEAQGEEADDLAHGLVGRLSRRNRDAPDRFDPSLDSALSAAYHPPGAAGASAHADGAPAAAAWTRAQLQAPGGRGSNPRPNPNPNPHPNPNSNPNPN